MHPENEPSASPASSPAAPPVARPEPQASPPTARSTSRSGLAALAEHPLFAPLLLVGLAVALLAPRLSHEGLWDPHEVRLLESASEPFDPHTLWQAKSFRPTLLLLPVTLGARLFGLNELGGRSPLLVLGLLLLVAVYALGRWLGAGRERLGALFAGLLLLTSPLFFLSARHISLPLLPMLGQTLAVFGLALLAWPRAGARPLDLGLGALFSLLGLAIGLLTTGALVGVAAPLIAVTVALALSGGPWLPQLIYGGACGAVLIPVARQILHVAGLPSSWRFGLAGACLLVAAFGVLVGRDRRVLGLSALSALVAVGLLPALPAERPVGYSPWFAGLLHFPTSREPQVDTVLRGLGFYLFPWSGLLPLGLVAVFQRLGGWPTPAPTSDGEIAADGEGRTDFARLLPLCWFVAAYTLTTLHSALVGDLSFPAAPALALLGGAYLAQLLADPGDDRLRSLGGAAAGLCAGLGIVMVGRDFFFSPEHYLSAHLTDALRWPAPLAPVGQWLSVAAIVLGGVFGLGIASEGILRRRLILCGVGLSLLGAGVAVHGLSPALARHVSYRGLYTRYQKLGGGALGLYGVPQSSGRIYGQNSVNLYSLPDVMSFLFAKANERSFVIVGAAELAALDREARLRGSRYYVVDDSNAQFLLLTNRLLPGETDSNPLRRFVSDTAPHPQVTLPAPVVFDDKLELIGYDVPPEISRGDDLVVRLHFRVLGPIPTAYRVFLHFDGMGTRWNGDHVPLDGKYPTNFWTPNTYVTDEHRMSVSRISQPAGYYQIFTGFWPGGDGPRLKVTAGSHEADQRVRLGVIRVK